MVSEITKNFRKIGGFLGPFIILTQTYSMMVNLVTSKIWLTFVKPAGLYQYLYF